MKFKDYFGVLGFNLSIVLSCLEIYGFYEFKVVFLIIRFCLDLWLYRLGSLICGCFISYFLDWVMVYII